MISRTVEYALRAVVALAENTESPVTAQQIGELTGVPGAYLAKIMQSLVRANLVNSQRGLYGGFSLATKPNEMTLWDVVEVVDPFRRFNGCPAALGDRCNRLVLLYGSFDEALALVENVFRKKTLADLTSNAR